MSITPLVPAPKLSKALRIKNKIFLKREDLHPLKSHKGRSIPIMIEHYAKQGITDFVISSSGNAALAAALFVKKYNRENNKNLINLEIFVGEKIQNEKFKPLLKLTDKNIVLKKISNPKQTAFKKEKTENKKWLRQSTDDTALLGYKFLAQELIKIKKMGAIFIPTSSGTTAVGLYQAFKKEKTFPEIHIIQTTACHPFIKTNKPDTKTSLASAIVDLVGYRKKEIEKIIKNSKGGRWIADDEEIKTAIKLFKKTTGLKITPNSALSLIGLTKAIENKKIAGAIVLLITGK